MTKKPILLVDAKNALYRSIFAVRSDRRPNSPKYHYFTVLMKQISSWIKLYNPESVCVFWDAPRSKVWRKAILESYKDRTNNTYIEDISEDIAKTTYIAKEMFKHLNVRQFDKKRMEADDLIYAAVTILHPHETVIISTDSDMIQIPYNFSSCKVYNPFKQKEVEIPSVNPAMQKALVGDKSDAIPGYSNIGPKKSEKLLNDKKKFQEFLVDGISSIVSSREKEPQIIVGPKTFYRNMLLIDLSLNPKLLNNKVYVDKVMSNSINFDMKKINELIKKYKINGLMQEHVELVLPFKNLK